MIDQDQHLETQNFHRHFKISKDPTLNLKPQQTENT